MRPTPLAQLGVAALVLTMALVSLAGIVTSLSFVATDPTRVLDAVVRATQLPALVLVTAGLMWRERLGLPVAAATATLTGLGSLGSLILSLPALTDNSSTTPSWGQLLWAIGFGTAAIAAFVLWRRTSRQSDDQTFDAWAEPARAYADAVHSAPRDHATLSSTPGCPEQAAPSSR